MFIKYLFAGVLLLTSVQAKNHVLTIDTLIKIALEHSPDIDISRFDFEGAQQRAKYTEGFYLPRLDINFNGGKQYAKNKNNTRATSDILAGTLGASQLLYDFGKTAGRVTGSQSDALSLQAQMQQIISDKILNVKQNYYDILKTKSIITVQRKNVKLQQQQLYRAQKYLVSGIKTIIDVSDAKVQLEQAQLDLHNAQYELEIQRAKLEETLGYVPYSGKYRVYSKKLSLPKVSYALPQVKTSLYRLQSFAYAHRYVLQSSKYIVSGAKAYVEAEKGEYAPTITLNGQYSKHHIDNNVLAVSPEEQGQVTVSMNWNLFSGFQTDASVQEAKINVLKASSQVQSVKLAIKRQVLESHISLRRNKNNVELSESISAASFQKFQQAQKRYENDLSDYVELQDAQQGYIKSLSDLVSAYYDYFIAMAQLDHAIGK
jgi:outer membrane protein